mmetsp:Transcript_2601/g.16828  ORF Transcript_2601/g.16828 Transcript_2601/m.16828 type:complete len:218 (+) Transcript_2601:1589-2242(+)
MSPSSHGVIYLLSIFVHCKYTARSRRKRKGCLNTVVRKLVSARSSMAGSLSKSGVSFEITTNNNFASAATLLGKGMGSAMTFTNCTRKNQARIANFQLHVIADLLLSTRIAIFVVPRICTGHQRCRCDATFMKKIPMQTREPRVERAFLGGRASGFASAPNQTLLCPKTIANTRLVVNPTAMFCAANATEWFLGGTNPLAVRGLVGNRCSTHVSLAS